MEETSRDAAARARQLLALRETLLRESDGARALTDQLLTNPYVTIAKVAEVEEVTQPTATKIVKALVAKGLLRETTGKNWRKIYVASGVLEALEQRQNS